MLLIMAVALLAGSVFIEMILVRKIRPLRWINERSTLAGVALSMGISLLLGALFGLSGLVAGIAGIGSSMITEPIHWVNRKIKRGNDATAQFIVDAKATYLPVFRLIKIAFLICLAPLWIPVKIRGYLRAAEARSVSSAG